MGSLIFEEKRPIFTAQALRVSEEPVVTVAAAHGVLFLFCRRASEVCSPSSFSVRIQALCGARKIKCALKLRVRGGLALGGWTGILCSGGRTRTCDRHFYIRGPATLRRGCRRWDVSGLWALRLQRR